MQDRMRVRATGVVLAVVVVIAAAVAGVAAFRLLGVAPSPATELNETKCPPADENPSDLPLEPDELLPLTTIAQGNSGGPETAESLLVRDCATWKSVWYRTYGRDSPVPELPAVDFANVTVIAVFFGLYRSCGAGITIQRVFALDEVLAV